MITYQNNRTYTFDYDDNGLLTQLSEDGRPYGTYAYDCFGNYLSIDTADYSISYLFDYPLYRADYSFGATDNVRKSQILSCEENAYEHGDIVVLTDGSDGAEIPRDLSGELLSYDSSTRTLVYRIGEEEHTIKYNSQGYVICDSLTVQDEEIGREKITINEYAYDAYGNILQVTTNVDGMETVHTYSYDKGWNDELKKYDGQMITYDILGKPAKYYNGAEFSWAGGKLAEITTGEMQATYEYDYHGLRTAKNVNGLQTRYIYEGRDLIAELSEDPIYYTYDGNFELVGFEWNGEAYYYQYDIFGDVVAIVNAEGEEVCTYSYDVWGDTIESQGDQAVAKRNPIRYRGYYFDEESGLYCLETRYYDPHIKRFISYDDLESFFYGNEEAIESLFVYSGNDPVRFYDPDGRSATYSYQYCTVAMALAEWKNEAISFASDMCNYVIRETNVESGTVLYNEYKNAKKFIDDWNALNENSCDAMLIDTHGSPTSIGTGDGVNSFRYSDFTKIKINTGIKLIILLGCNCGHYDYYSSNMAYGFLKKTHGCIVASDGTVFPNILGGFSSVGDESFIDYLSINPGRKNKGWIIWSGSPDKFRTFFTGWSGWFSNLTAKKIMKYVFDKGLVEKYNAAAGHF